MRGEARRRGAGARAGCSPARRRGGESPPSSPQLRAGSALSSRGLREVVDNPPFRDESAPTRTLRIEAHVDFRRPLREAFPLDAVPIEKIAETRGEAPFPHPNGVVHET